MKKVILLTFATALVSCDIIVVEPSYDGRDRITGTFQVEEYSQTYNSYMHFSVWVSKSGYSNEIIINNFYDAGIHVRADVVGDKIYIPWQQQDGYEVEGVGTIYGDELQMNYTVKDTYDHKPADFCETEAWRSY